MADRVAVMYAGRIVEEADVRTLFAEPLHPYTQGLISSLPILGEVKDRLDVIPGTVPNLIDLPAGCKFAPRCRACVEHDLKICTEVDPQLESVAHNHKVRCWLYQDDAAHQHQAPRPQNRRPASPGGVTRATGRAGITPIAGPGRIPPSNGKRILVTVKDLAKYFSVRGGMLRRAEGQVKAVDGVSFTIGEGTTLGLVGESGCGKTTVGRTVLRLSPATQGTVIFDGQDVFKANKRELKTLRRDMQIIFQDPFSSLDPRMTVGESIGLGLQVHGMRDAQQRQAIVTELLRKVGLEDYHARRYPHEFSGGQRQRVGIARALALNPKFIVCDEPVSALDVSIQSQILNLLRDLQRELNLAYLFIAHNLSVVEHISDQVAVMYLGKIVEMADRDELFRNPQHPYTQALMSAIPIPNPTFKRERVILKGECPSPLNPPTGCRFHTRCPMAMAGCDQQEPALKEVSPGHWAACWLVE
jgi:peptide/nickel transport system ATP-binding protein/oligopeptide transport system ATP-binding protein